MNAMLLVAYIAAFMVSGEPDAPVSKVVSLLPPLAPLVMPVRAASGHTAPWEVAVAMLLTAAAIAGLVRLAGFIYARGILQSGGRLSFRRALRQEPVGATVAAPPPRSGASPHAGTEG